VTVFEILQRYWPAFWGGLKTTLQLSGITWCIGLIGGVPLGVAAHRALVFRWVSRCLSFFLAGIPFLVLLYWAHFPVQVLLGVVIDPFITSASVLCLLNVVGVAEVCRVALDGFPQEYLQAAKVCGLSRRATILEIQLPMVFRQTIPGLMNLQVLMLQMTLFASLISVEELFRVAQQINSAIYRPVEIYSALAVFFLAICLPLNGLAAWLRYRFTRDLSDR
jgi:polar amino acid transport system permease protein